MKHGRLVVGASLALALDTSPQAVSDLTKRGVLKQAPDGRYPLDLNLALYEARVRPRAKNGELDAADAGGADAGDEAGAGGAPDTYRGARAAREFYASQRERLAYEREVGGLLVRADVVDAARHAATLVRTEAEQLAERLPVRLAALGGDEAGIRALLVAEVEGYLWQVERAYGAIAEREEAA